MFNATAPAPSRATGTITLSVGVLPITLSVFTGTEETRVKRSEFYKGDVNVPVGRAAVRKDTGEVISSDDVVRMAEADSGARVAVSDEEIADCTSPKGLAEVECFVKLSDLSSYLTEGVLQVRPKREKGKANPAVEKAFAVLLAGMRQRKVAALFKVAMRGPARYALLTPEGNMLLVHTADQVREPREVVEVAVSKPEVAMMGNLIDAIGIDTPVITDTTAPVVQAFVNAKAKGVPAPAKPAAPAVQADIMAVLEASIAARKGKEVA